MRILHTVEFYTPSVGGAQEVVRQISERLAARGHEVTVATTRLAERRDRCPGGVRIEEFDISGNAVLGCRGETGRYQQFLLDSRFDVMLNYAAQQWTTDLALPVLERLAARKVLAPCGFSGLLSRDYEGYFAELPSVLRRYDHLVFHGAAYRDAEFAKRHGLLRSTVIPNGAAEEEFGAPDPRFRARHGIPEGVPLILTVGSHTGAKGHGLVMRALQKARIGRSVLAIIGNVFGGRGCVRSCRWRARWTRLASLGRTRVLLLDPPRREVVAAYHAADLFAFGSNVECSPIVLFEAMASRTPFVTAAVGNAEEIARWSGGGVVLPTAQRADGSAVADATAMARALEDLVARPEERERLGEAGHRAWRERFTWDRIAGSYEALYRSLVGQKPTSAREA
jgi:glycosyltransferase involved in cell wall biosynthesis